MRLHILSVLSVILLVGTLQGCKKEEKRSFYNLMMTGKWSLVRQYGGIMGENEMHDSGTITWDFDGQNSRVYVVNPTNNSVYFHLSSGNYPFTVHEQDGGYYLSINGYEIGKIFFDENQCKIDANLKRNTELACSYYVILENEWM